jgi:hypothetical protein
MARWRTGTLGVAALLAACAAHARVGESLKQSEARYGGPGKELEDDGAFILKNARNVAYRHGDWIITAAYVNDVTLRIQYEKVGGQQPRARLGKEEVAEIMEAEDAGGWIVFNEQTQKSGKAYTGESYPPPVMRSASGLTARYRVFSVTVESPAAARHEAGFGPRHLRTPVPARVAL